MKKQQVKTIIKALARRDFHYYSEMLCAALVLCDYYKLNTDDFFYELGRLVVQEKQAKTSLKSRKTLYSWHYNQLVYAEAALR